MKLLSALILFALTMVLSAQSIAKGHEDAATKNNKLFPAPTADLANGQLPSKVELEAPAFQATVSGATTLKWKAVDNAKNYHVQMATDPNFKWLLVDAHMHGGTSYDVKDLEAGKHYFWRVAATNQEKWDGSTKGFYSKSMFQTK